MIELPPTIFIIVGATGDVSRRLLLPALARLGEHGALPYTFKIIGTSRKDPSEIDGLHMMRLATPNDAVVLREYIEQLEERYTQAFQVVAYLAVPPSGLLSSAALLAETGIISRIIVEKPFGHDAESARELATELTHYFTPSQIIRADHYLSKQVLIDALQYVQQVQGELIEITITIDESIDIQGRVSFYEETGALRDMVQSHALLLAATVYASAYDTTRVQALQLLAPAVIAYRAQYEGYTDEVQNPASAVETFTHLETSIGATKLIITTGKALDRKETSIRLVTRMHGKDTEMVCADTPSEVWHPTGYEKVLLDACDPVTQNTISEAEMELLWTWIDAVRAGWVGDKKGPICYPKGSTQAEVLTKF